jgi:hypothetical protein
MNPEIIHKTLCFYDDLCERLASAPRSERASRGMALVEKFAEENHDVPKVYLMAALTHHDRGCTR